MGLQISTENKTAICSSKYTFSIGQTTSMNQDMGQICGLLHAYLEPHNIPISIRQCLEDVVAPIVDYVLRTDGAAATLVGVYVVQPITKMATTGSSITSSLALWPRSHSMRHHREQNHQSPTKRSSLLSILILAITVHHINMVKAALMQSQQSFEGKERLLMISNRLPITITRPEGEQGWKMSMSSGGLVSALSGLKKNTTFTWIGWPGPGLPADEHDKVAKQLMDEHNCVPVFLDDEVADKHYNGFSNSILWPLFHYHPGEISFNEDHWEAYQQANQKFAEVLADIVEDGDLVWVHDYHLMLLPQLLRQLIGSKRGVKIGFFLHTPFPSSEVYRILPVRKQVLLGVLSADLLGFHTYDYARHFLSSCTRILGLHTAPNGVEFEGRQVHVGTFPIGIDPPKFADALQAPQVQARVAKLKEKFNGMKLLVGVDRLDYIKGVPQKLHALELFFEKHPEWQEKVVLCQVAVPSRQDVEEYQHLRNVVNELVGQINGRFGTIEFTPIHYMHKSVTFNELVALYAIADACIISSTRDGMNLVSYEYICCQEQKNGVLILSEFAGAAQSLNGSIIVNPWNTEEMAQAIHDAVTMPDDVRKANHQKLWKYVHKYTAAFWGENFVRELQNFHLQDQTRMMLLKLSLDTVTQNL
ncbi:alpha,alpha-trehalose-phosphate synthase (UDP-forming) [Synchytrium endobioticum]|uniref:alpha,alpha-trehalose-phosphate synthase (UDP-forming) n=1 Tax=Synchytrium endobioticum TaxID=286115 RepID=A0A507CFV4_9FUNG|nr:alpha,alpha-trehalose-phosphate synthase (UDP-forming) [Synchytrium endobioticum]